MKAKRLVLGKSLATIFMSVAMALVFMPIIGADVSWADEDEDEVWDGSCVGWINDETATESLDDVCTTIDRGESVTLQVQAFTELLSEESEDPVRTNYNDVKYQWEKGEWVYNEDTDESIWNGTLISGETNNAYTTGKLKESSYYRCTISDNNSAATATIGFSVYIDTVYAYGWASDNPDKEPNSWVYADKYPKDNLTLYIKPYTEYYDEDNDKTTLVEYNAEGLQYRWEIGHYDYDDEEADETPWIPDETINGAEASSYTITNLEEDTIYRGYVIDSDGDEIGYVEFDVTKIYQSIYLEGWIKNRTEGDNEIAVNPGTAVTLNAQALTYDQKIDKEVPVTEEVVYHWYTEYWDEDEDDYIRNEISTETKKGTPSSVTVRPSEYTIYLCEAVCDGYDDGDDVTTYFYISTDTSDVAAYNVSASINNLKPVEQLTLNDKAAVMQAKAAYDALSAGQKEDWISSSQEAKLLKAVLRIQELQKQADDKAAADKAAAQKAAQVTAYKKAVAAAKKLNVSGLSVKAKAKKATITWKVNKKATGYVVQYSSKKNFKKDAKKVRVKKAKTKKLVVKKLKAGKTYYFRIATYKQVKNPTTGKIVTTQGKWSKAKKVKVK